MSRIVRTSAFAPGPIVVVANMNMSVVLGGLFGTHDDFITLLTDKSEGIITTINETSLKVIVSGDNTTMLERGTGPYGSILLGQNGRGYVLGPNENGTDSVRPIPWSGSDINDLFVGKSVVYVVAKNGSVGKKDVANLMNESISFEIIDESNIGRGVSDFILSSAGDLFFTTADMELRVLEENDEKSKIIEETKRKDGSRPIPHFSTAGTLIYESENGLTMLRGVKADGKLGPPVYGECSAVCGGG
eukprot:UC4_evm1s195